MAINWILPFLIRFLYRVPMTVFSARAVADGRTPLRLPCFLLCPVPFEEIVLSPTWLTTDESNGTSFPRCRSCLDMDLLMPAAHSSPLPRVHPDSF